MGNSTSRRTMVLGYFLIVCLSLGIILFSIYTMNKVCEESDFIIDKILATKTSSMKILTSLINQETGIETYIISGDKVFLERYYLERKQIQEYYKSLDNSKNTILGIALALSNIIFIRYIRNYMYEEVKKKNEVNKELQKLLILEEEFIANISHELKTPLNVISSTVQLLRTYYCNGSLDKKKDSVIKYIDSMRQNCYRLSRLINNIVDSSKIEAGFFELNLSNNNIVEVVEEIVMSITNFTESKGLNIIFDTNIEEKIIACDPEKIERIVLNLISNAIKFSAVGDEIFVEVKDKNESVEISVKDTGIGLSLVKSIVELHGGSISVESESGKGSKFTVVLPSRRVMQENMLFSSNIRNKSESIQVEFSDVNL